jgi:streptogramin lyase
LPSILATKGRAKSIAVTVDERGVVYVCDKGNGAIYRFKLSNSLDEDLKPED